MIEWILLGAGALFLLGRKKKQSVAGISGTSNYYYLIDDSDGYEYETLKDVRWHVEMMNNRDRSVMDGTLVFRINKKTDDITDVWKIHASPKKVSLSKEHPYIY